MDELRSKLNKLLADAADYDLIAQLATDPDRRDAFRVLAAQTRDIASKLKQLILSGETG